MFLTDARELGAREVAPDALLVKLPKKKRKIKKSNKSEENPENRKKVLVDPGRHFPVPYFLFYLLISTKVGQSGSSRETLCGMEKGVICHPDLRCVKMRRIGSRSNVYTNVSQPLRSLLALGYEPAVCRARLAVSV